LLSCSMDCRVKVIWLSRQDFDLVACVIYESRVWSPKGELKGEVVLAVSYNSRASLCLLLISVITLTGVGKQHPESWFWPLDLLWKFAYNIFFKFYKGSLKFKLKSSVTAGSTICHHNVVSNSIHCACYAYLLIKKMLKNTALTSWPGKALATFNPALRIWSMYVWLYTGFGLVNGFIDHLFTWLRTASSCSTITNLHNLQITTALAKPFHACCVFTNHSMASASDVGNSLSLHAQVLSSQTPTQNSNNWLCPLLVTSRHRPCRNSNFVVCEFVCHGNVFTEPLPRNSCYLQSQHLAVGL
jgi:hypothetical protein